MDNAFAKVKETVQERSDATVESSFSNSPDIATKINRRLNAGFNLLYIGQETVLDEGGKHVQCTVAVLGK